MKFLFCAYDRPGHIASGPNAWIQRLIPDLRDTYSLDISTLFIYNGKSQDCPTLSFFKANELPVFTIDRENTPYVADQVKDILEIIKNNEITVLIANLVIPAYYASRFLKPFNIPVVGVLHSNDTFYKGVVAKFINGQSEDRLSAVVSVSSYIQSLAETELNEVVFKTIPCGTNLSHKLAERKSSTRLKVIYAGRLVIEAKQILKLTDAFLSASESNEDYEFNIYGDGDQERYVLEMINISDSNHHVTLHKALPPSEILDKIAEHHIFTLMSDYEGMPLSLMEAMACGVVPVCYINEGGVEEIIENGKNGFIVKDRTDDYQKHLKILLNDYELWNTMSNAAIKTIKNQYSSTITHRQWFDLLRSFEDKQTNKIKFPARIRLHGDLLHYGDNRKPSTTSHLKKRFKEQWYQFKMFLRPRARIRSIFKNVK